MGGPSGIESQHFEARTRKRFAQRADFDRMVVRRQLGEACAGVVRGRPRVRCRLCAPISIHGAIASHDQAAGLEHARRLADANLDRCVVKRCCVKGTIDGRVPQRQPAHVAPHMKRTVNRFGGEEIDSDDIRARQVASRPTASGPDVGNRGPARAGPKAGQRGDRVGNRLEPPAPQPRISALRIFAAIRADPPLALA